MKQTYSVLYWSTKEHGPVAVSVRASDQEGAVNAAMRLDDCKYVMGVEQVAETDAEGL